MSRCDLTFPAMGAEIRVIIGEPGPDVADPAEAATAVQGFIAKFEAALSRFREDSELTALNTDPREAVPASSLLRDAVRAGLWAAKRTDGLVDPTLLRQIESAGYARSRKGIAPAPLKDALALAPVRRPARPNPDRPWRRFRVDEEMGVVHRPPGLGFDTGGTGKGLAADLIAERLQGYAHFVIDCGGDIRVGGLASSAEAPFEIEVEHPITGNRSHVLRLVSGGVATSGVNVRVWRTDAGTYAHHLLDPSTGQPAWTGLVGATAIGDSALEAETLSKAALLSGPSAARRFLSAKGGLLVHDDGFEELVGPLDIRPKIAVTVPRSLVDRAGVLA